MRKLWPYIVVVFLGYTSYSIQFPFYPEIFLHPEKSILPHSMSIEMKTIILGIVMASYPLGQLVGAPLVGIFSDRWGRRRVIMTSLSIKALGYGIIALGMKSRSLETILGGLVVCGLAEANITLAQAVVGDLMEKEERVKYFGRVNFFAALPFLIGPLVGVALSKEASFSFATPFWWGAALSVVSIGIVWRFAQESKEKFFTQPLWVGVKETWKNETLRRFYFTVMLIYFGLYAFLDCIGIYLERDFGFATAGIAYVKAYDAFFYSTGLLLLVPWVAKRSKPYFSMGLASIGFGLALIALVIPSSSQALWLTIPPIGFMLSIIMTNAAGVVSTNACQILQGHALGTLQSFQVFGGISVGLFGGLLAAIKPDLPLIVGAMSATLCGILLLRRA